jgi:CubicO group peptidase (beta-lactamase class C family)
VTSIAVAQLWERGQLALDDPVAAHIPEFAAHGKQAVTIRHVLTHTGGFRHTVPATDPWDTDWDVYVARICDSPLEPGWQPGARAGYHMATGFHVLGEIVRRRAGRDFADYVTDEIFEPLDMADSWMCLTEDRYAAYGDRMGAMYDTNPPSTEGSVVRGFDSHRGFRRVVPAGSGVGPMSDLVKVFEMLLGGGARLGERVLERTTVEAISARHRTAMLDETFGTIIDWGLGLMVNSWHYKKAPAPYGYGDHASMRAFGHGGQQSSLAFADPEFGLAVALCCNGMPGEAANHRRTQPVITAVYEELGLGA